MADEYRDAGAAILPEIVAAAEGTEKFVGPPKPPEAIPVWLWIALALAAYFVFVED